MCGVYMCVLAFSPGGLRLASFPLLEKALHVTREGVIRGCRAEVDDAPAPQLRAQPQLPPSTTLELELHQSQLRVHGPAGVIEPVCTATLSKN